MLKHVPRSGPRRRVPSSVSPLWYLPVHGQPVVMMQRHRWPDRSVLSRNTDGCRRGRHSGLVRSVGMPRGGQVKPPRGWTVSSELSGESDTRPSTDQRSKMKHASPSSPGDCRPSRSALQAALANSGGSSAQMGQASLMSPPRPRGLAQDPWWAGDRLQVGRLGDQEEMVLSRGSSPGTSPSTAPSLAMLSAASDSSVVSRRACRRSPIALQA